MVGEILKVRELAGFKLRKGMPVLLYKRAKMDSVHPKKGDRYHVEWKVWILL